MRTISLAGATLLIAGALAVPAAAQPHDRPEPPPVRTAAGTAWYSERAPIPIGDSLYRPAGALVFFDPETMVRIGYHEGVPLYADTTLEPHSLVFVPIGRGLMQPYERPRTGALAGTVGSRTPSFPVQSEAEADAAWQPLPTGTSGGITAGAAVPDIARDEVRATRPLLLQTAWPPRDSPGVWIAYEGGQWTSAGPAVPLVTEHFTRVGDYHGFAVYRRGQQAGAVIYVPSRDGWVAPYRRRGAIEGSSGDSAIR